MRPRRAFAELSNRAVRALRAGSSGSLRAASLVVTDRRWAAPLSAMALGFGLFIGVAIGPGAGGSLATGPAQILEIPALASDEDAGAGTAAEGPAGFAESLGDGLGGGGGGGSLDLPPLPESFAQAPLEAAPAEEGPAPGASPPASGPPQEAQVESTELKGIVVGANPAAGSYALAIRGGEMVSVHARKLPPPGARLTVLAHQLANGTFAEDAAPKRSGRAAVASLRGAITFVDTDPAAPAYTLSGRGASLLIHVRPDPAGAVPELPQRGAYATVTAEIAKPPAKAPPPPEPPATPPSPEPACARDPALSPPRAPNPTLGLWQGKIDVEDTPPSTYIDLAGTITAICPAASQLLFSADGSGVSGSDLALGVPVKIKTAKLRVGDSYLATATIEEDGSLALAGLASDEQVKGADDPSSAQGDLKRPN